MIKLFTLDCPRLTAGKSITNKTFKALTGVFLALFCLVTLNTTAQSTFNCPDPDRCTSKDLEVIGAFLTAEDCSCDAGETVSALLNFKLLNKTGSERTSFAFFATLVRTSSTGQVTTSEISRCTSPVLPGSTTTITFNDPITFKCGDQLKLTNVYLAWTDASDIEKNDCATILADKCAKIAPKCGTDDEIIITPLLTAQVTSSIPACIEGVGGSVTVTPTGGTGPYDITINGTTRENVTSATFNNLPADTYTITVEDAAGCEYVFTYSLGQIDCCEFEVTCPTNTNLGTFNCNTLANIPGVPQTVAALQAAPYGITIGTDPCGTIRFSVASDNPTVNVCAASNQTISRVITIWDDLNNNSVRDTDEEYETCTFTYTIDVDDTDPTITCPANATVQCLADIPAEPASLAAFLALTGADADDDCDQSLTYSVTTGQLVGGACGGTVTRTHTVTDNCGNATSCQQVFTVNDDTDPTITCPAGATFQLASQIPAEPASLAAFLALTGADADDNCDQSLTYSVTTGPLVGTACGGTITRTHTVTDDCGNTASCNQVFNINDDTPPTITCPANATVECLANIPAAPTSLAAFLALTGADADDNGSGTLTYSVTTGSLVGGPCGGTVTRTHTVTDDCGNTASCNQVFTVDDNTAPTITQAEGADFTADCEVDPAPLFVAPVFADNCGGTPTVTVTNSQAPGPNNSVVYTRTWTATDACQNQTQASQSITVPPCPIPPPPPTGNEGCTPGYWKNARHNWSCTSGTLTVSQNTEFFDVFTGVNNLNILGDADITMLEALSLSGGGYNALARHAAAAYLNACNTNVDYPYTTEAIVAAVVTVLNGGEADLGTHQDLDVEELKNVLAAANELGCPINNAGALESVTTRARETGELTLLASPNPFNSNINFNFVAPESGRVTLEIFDLMGRKLANIFEGQVEKGTPKTIYYRVPSELRVPMIYRLTMGSQTRFGKLLPGSTD